MLRLVARLAGALWLAVSAPAQTTQALVSGRVLDAQDGTPLAGARIVYSARRDGQKGSAAAGAGGRYHLPMLSPGTYALRAEAAGYQAQEMHEVVLPVAGFLEIDFRLRPLSDVWERGLGRGVLPMGNRGVVTFYGPDLDTTRSAALAPSGPPPGDRKPAVSEVIGGQELASLPLAGRDAYTLLVTLAGVTSDAATARGLGLSVSGQRPSASNFLLDGVEHNSYLTSGPLTPVAPEALQEYRVSMAHFSAEYGRTAGLLANAVTRSGGNRWHGMAYHYLKEEPVSAGDREAQPGAWVGGPIVRDSLFVSGGFEWLRHRARQEPVTLYMPTLTAHQFQATGEGRSQGQQWLERYQPGPIPTERAWSAPVTFEPPASLDRGFAMARLDRLPGSGAWRSFGRFLGARVERPDFIWTPYTEFSSPLWQNTLGLALGLAGSPRPSVSVEARLNVADDDLGWDRAHPEIPTLFSSDATVLPGSPAFYAYRNRMRNWEGQGALQWTDGAHFLKAGGGYLRRTIQGYLTAGRDGRFLFDNLTDFLFGWPSFWQGVVERARLPALVKPDYRRRYRNHQFFLFAEDAWKARPGLLLTAGLRYENFGGPSSLGPAPDAGIRLGEGASLPERIARAEWDVLPQGLYDADNNNLAARLGFAWRGRYAVLRAAYGIFYDRPFDNLWQNLRSNAVVLVDAPLERRRTDLLAPYQGAAAAQEFPLPTLYQPGLRDAYVESYHATLQRALGERVSLELGARGSLGRKLITTDKWNRPVGRLNSRLPELSYRANQGGSSFHALGLSASFQSPSSFLRLAYTWSHAIDNQSEPLAGDFFDLAFTRPQYGEQRAAQAAFSRAFDSRVDRASSDFDQRHSLVAAGSWALPRPLAGFRFSALAALRSGFPFTVFSPAAGYDTSESIYNRRPDLVDPGAARIRQEAPGGFLLLAPEAFRAPTPDRQGTLGRNALSGPGLVNLDVSLSRTLRLAETWGLTLRADAFNVLNHRNLNQPNPYLASPEFGLALYGRRGRDGGFPALSPLNETGRQVQILLRIEF